MQIQLSMRNAENILYNTCLLIDSFVSSEVIEAVCQFYLLCKIVRRINASNAKKQNTESIIILIRVQF